ncbi:hypothetical protein KAU45_10660 [bacterium]|nr:hypothetical protein [bacterium]
MRIWRSLALLSCLLFVAALAEEAERLPDPFLDGLLIGDNQLDVQAALEENGWETSAEWYNVDFDPIFRVRGEMDNRVLIYEFNVYGRLYHLNFLEHWSSIGGLNSAYATWSEWLKIFYGTPEEGDDGYPSWSVGGYEIKIYDRTFIARENTSPTMMINIFPESKYFFHTEDEVIIRSRED